MGNTEVNSEYIKAKNHIKNSYIACQGKGATIPEKKNLQNLPTCIDSIEAQYGAMLTTLEIESQPTTTSYIEGEPIDLSGMKVVAVYDNGAKKDISDCCTCTPCAGTLVALTDTCIDIEYTENKKCCNLSVPITVAPYVRVLQSIEVTNPPKKTIYIKGNYLDLTGLEITATYGRGERVVVTEDCTTTPANKAQLSLSNNKINISYTENGITKTTQLAIAVENSTRTLVDITIQSNPTKLSYYTGENFDPTGLKVIASFVGDITEDVTENCSFTPSVFSSTQTTSVTVSYSEGDIEKSKTIPITVVESVVESIEIAEQPKTNYFVGQTFDTDGMKILAVYNSGKKVDVTSQCSISNDDPLTISDTSITITYSTFSVTIPITVQAVTMTSIEITKQPTKLIYYVGESVDISGIEVTAHFNNGSTMVLQGGYTATPTTLSQSDTSITVNYQGLTAQVEVQVLAPVIFKIEVTTPPIKTSYFITQSIDTSGIVVTGTYTDGTTEDVTSKCTFTPTEPLTADITAITAHYGDLTATTPITVSTFAPVALTIEKAPNKTTYLVGDDVDLAGLIVKVTYNDNTTSQFLNGDGVTATPSENLEATNTSLTISYSLNGVTVTGTVAITVIQADSTLANNSWETISTIAEMGKASEVWSVGDTKSATIDGVSYEFRIIGFNHDNKSDGSGKAGITFEMVNFLNSAYAFGNTTNVKKIVWNTLKFYTEFLPALLEKVDSTLKPYIKPVLKITGDSTNVLHTDTHSLFILSTVELTTAEVKISGRSPVAGEGTTYNYYSSGNSIAKTQKRWTRTVVYNGVMYYGLADVKTDGNFEYAALSNNYYLPIAFCI